MNSRTNGSARKDRSASVGNVAIIGARSMLAQELMRVLDEDPAFGWVAAGARPDVDLTDLKTVEHFLADSKPSVVVNCAAMTDVDACESRVAEAFAVNAEGAGRAAAMAARRNAVFVQISTDYVFDGLKGDAYVEEDETSPLSVYGRSKLEGERMVEASGGDYVIIRTAWVFGRGRRNFVDRMLAAARERGEVAAVTDQRGSPTSARDLAQAIAVVIKARVTGTYHIANVGGASRFDVAQAAIQGAALSARLIAARSADFPRPARTPADSTLSAARLQRDTGHVLRPWREAVMEYAAAKE